MKVHVIAIPEKELNVLELLENEEYIDEKDMLKEITALINDYFNVVFDDEKGQATFALMNGQHFRISLEEIYETEAL